MTKIFVLKFIAYVLVTAMFLFGLCIFMYPLLSGYVSDRNTSKYVDGFENKKISYSQAKQYENNEDTQSASAEDSNQEKNNFTDNKIYQDAEALDDLYREMERYNINIYKSGQEGLCDAWAYEQSGFDLSQYGIYNGVVGVLRVPKMSNLEMPIFLGASRNNMSLGATQLGQTSMPIGGNNTNCVLAGHRGWNGARYFLDIEQMAIGDMVYIENLWDTLYYKVTDIKVIYPDDIDEILIQENKDMVTLITCHPYWASTYRYAVFCTRTSSDGLTDGQITNDGQAVTQTATGSTDSAHEINNIVIENDQTSQTRILLEKYSYVVIPLILIALIIFLTVIRRKDR